MASELETGAMLRFLCASKPAGRILELGTGLATRWIAQGMDSDAILITADNDKAVLTIALIPAELIPALATSPAEATL